MGITILTQTLLCYILRGPWLGVHFIRRMERLVAPDGVDTPGTQQGGPLVQSRLLLCATDVPARRSAR